MAEFTFTLRDIIYHYSQELSPILNAESRNPVYPFVLPIDWTPIEEHVKIAMDKIISPSIGWSTTQNLSGQSMKELFWNTFCSRNMMREISVDQPPYWIWLFNGRISAVIDRYNRLWDSYCEKYDPLLEYEDHHGLNIESDFEGKEESEGHSESESSDESIYNDTPSTKLNDLDYATSITGNTGNAKSDSKSGTQTTNNRHDTHKENRHGHNQSATKLYEEYRNSLRNVALDMCMDIENEGLFFLVFDNGVY